MNFLPEILPEAASSISMACGHWCTTGHILRAYFDSGDRVRILCSQCMHKWSFPFHNSLELEGSIPLECFVRLVTIQLPSRFERMLRA
jgi:hypothetical protein